MNKLKKHFCYTSIDNLEILSKYKIKYLNRKDDILYFYIDHNTYELLKTIIYLETREIRYSKILNFFKKQLITIIGVILIILALINQSKSIVGVKFTNTDTYNEEIINYLEKYYKIIGPYKYLNASLNTINTDLRKTFYHYEWIGVRKNGAYLYLDIKEIKNTNYEDDKRPGSYYAKKSGIVKRYHVEKGIILVQEEEYVDINKCLISGEILYHDGSKEYIRAKGYVIAEVLEYKDFVVPKVSIEKVKTGKLIKQKEFYLFRKKLSKNKHIFNDYITEENEVFNLLNVLKVNEVYYYEVKSLCNTYTEEDAITYAKSLVINEFRLNKVNPYEKIIFNELVKIEVTEKEYKIRLIVKTYQNIAKFIPDEIRQ